MKVKHIILFLVGILLLSCQKKKRLPRPPNVILIITDDQGYGDLGFHKNPNIITPAIDAFAKKKYTF